MAVGANDTTFPNLGSESLGSPAVSVGEESGDPDILIAWFNMIELQNSWIVYSALAATPLSQILKRFNTCFSSGPALICGCVSAASRRSDRIAFSSSVGFESRVDVLRAWISTASFANRSVSFWVGGTFLSPISNQREVSETLGLAALRAFLIVVELVFRRDTINRCRAFSRPSHDGLICRLAYALLSAA